MTEDFAATFAALRAISTPYAPQCVVKTDSETEYYLDTTYVCKNRQPLFFAAVRVGKAYVSFHLMPIYVHPALLSDESAALRKRRQGKSGYNFKRPESSLFAELERLTATGFAAYQAAGVVNAATGAA